MFQPKLKITETAPDFLLPAADGNSYSLSSFKEKRGLIIIFSCNHCPYAQAYESRIIELQNDFAERGIQLVAINSNDAETYEEDSFENMKIRAAKIGYNFPYLRDESQQTARDYKAAHTPEIFFFDDKRSLIYTGKIDDNWQDETKVRMRYLQNAIEEFLAGKEISAPETYAVGCTIKWKQLEIKLKK